MNVKRSAGTSVVLVVLVLVGLVVNGTMAEASPRVRAEVVAADTLPSGTFALRVGILFDGESAAGDRIVEVRDGRVSAIRDGSEGSELPLLELADHALLPGLVDAHTHTFDATVLEQALAFGVTLHLDQFIVPEFLAGLKAGEAGGGGPLRADVRGSGVLATAPGGHGTQFGLSIPTLDGPGDAESFVQEQLELGADWIKIVIEDGSAHGRALPTLDAGTVAALVEAAHARDRLAVAHVSTLADARMAVSAGVDGLVHVWIDSVPDAGFIRELASRRVFVVPTLTVLRAVAGVPGAEEMLADPRVVDLLPLMARRSVSTTFPPSRAMDWPAVMESVRRLHAAGITVLAGSDGPNPGTAFGATMHGEMALLVEAGLSPVEAMRAATSAAADAFRVEGRGRIRVGDRADLVLVKGDPTRDIGATLDIAGVWKDGRPFDREPWRATVAAAVAAAEAPVSGPPALQEAGSLVVSDFSDGTLASALASPWAETTDAMMGGGSVVTLEVADDAEATGQRALRIAGTIDEDTPGAWAGAMVFPASPPMSPADLSAAAGLLIRVRGDGRPARLLVFTRETGGLPAYAAFEPGEDWQDLHFPWSAFRTDGSGVLGIALVGGPDAGPFQFLVDRVELR